MTRTIVLPSRDSPSDGLLNSDDTVYYVEDWFEYEQFDRAFSVLLAFRTEVPDDSPWRAQNIDFWRIYLREFFLQSRGNFKYLYPIMERVSEILNDSDDEVVFVWPTRDLVVELVQDVATSQQSTNKLSVRIDSSKLNPIPSVYYGDGFDASGTFRNVLLYLTAFGYLAAIHIMLIIGHVFPKSELEAEHLIYASPNHRELTDPIIKDDSVVISVLHPKLFPIVRSVATRDFRETMQQVRETVGADTAAAEDVFVGDLMTLAPYRMMFSLIRSRHEFYSDLGDHLVSHQFPSPPDEYLDRSFKKTFVRSSSLKFIAYLSLFQEVSSLSSLTSVSGGEIQEYLFEFGQKYGIETIDLNHSVLMNEPPEIHNNSDIIAVKGRPDMERLEQEDSPGRLVLTGRPYADELYHLLDSPEPRDLPRIFGEDGQTVLVATEPIRDEHIERVLQATFASQRADSVCIKLHPKESTAHYASLLDEIETGDTDYRIVADEYDLFDLIRASTAVVTVSSNVGLEALILGVPGIHVTVPPNVELYYQTLPYFERFMTNVDEAPETIDRFLQDGLNVETANEIREMYCVDGRASLRVLEKIYRS